jgi:predicted DNA-binding transcriptional regulator AlpA
MSQPMISPHAEAVPAAVAPVGLVPGYTAWTTSRSLPPVIHDSHARTPAAASQSGPCTEVTTSARPNSVATCSDEAGARSPLSGASGRAPTHHPAASMTPTAYRCVGDNSSSSTGPCEASRSTNPDTTRQACSTSAGDRTHNPSARPNTGPAGFGGTGTAGAGPLCSARIRRTALNSSGAIPHPRPHARPDPTTVRSPTDTTARTTADPTPDQRGTPTADPSQRPARRVHPAVHDPREQKRPRRSTAKQHAGTAAPIPSRKEQHPVSATVPAPHVRPAHSREKLTIAEVCAELKVSRSTFYYWRQIGKAPRCLVLPNREVRIRRCDLDNWLDSHAEGV